jgi:alginate O-acetyltransferase complex protein AlgI
MAFTSFPFFVFFPLVMILFYLIPARFRWILLLASSMVFYLAFSWQCLIFLLGMCLANYAIGTRIISKEGRLRKGIYISGIVLNLLVLVFFKYFRLPDSGLRKVADALHLYYPGQILEILFPLGISFFIFSAISYLVDIKKKILVAERNPGLLTTYFLFFPKLIQGPIERAGRVIPQFTQPYRFNYDDAASGLKLMAWGFFKKLVIADRLAVVVNGVYSHPGNYNGLTLVTATLFFAFQIYADFSGYTDIAVGASRMMGIRILQNFHAPYLSVSVKDFWNRWHISLSQWLRDYLFLPVSYALSRRLGRNFYLGLKTEHWIYIVAAFVTFITCGIWHGVGWNFPVWGGLFAFYLIFAQLTARRRKKFNRQTGLSRRPALLKAIQMISTFFLVTFAWIFFRSGSLTEAFTVIRNSFHGWSPAGISDAVESLSGSGLSSHELILSLAGIFILLITDLLSEKKDIFLRIMEKPLLLRWILYYGVILAILFYGVFDKRPFIYQQF